MTEVMTYRPERDELSYTFGGRSAVRRVAPGTILELYTEDCFGGQVRDFDQLFVISHDDTFEQTVDHVVAVTRETVEEVA